MHAFDLTAPQLVRVRFGPFALEGMRPQERRALDSANVPAGVRKALSRNAYKAYTDRGIHRGTRRENKNWGTTSSQLQEQSRISERRVGAQGTDVTFLEGLKNEGVSRSRFGIGSRVVESRAAVTLFPFFSGTTGA